MSDFSNTSTLRDYVRVLFRHKAVIITAFVTVMLTVNLGLMYKTPTYEAGVKMLVSAEKQVESPYYHEFSEGQGTDTIATQADIVLSDPILERTVRALQLYELPLDYEKRFCSPLKARLVDAQVKMMKTRLSRLTPEEQKGYRFRMAMDNLRSSIKIEPIPNTSLFYIKVRDFSGYGAAVLANVISRSYVIFDLEQQVAELQIKYGEKNLAVTQLKDNITQMEKGLNGEPISNIDAIGPASVNIIEQAQIPMAPHGLPRHLLVVLAFFMSICLGVILAFLFEYANPTYKFPWDIENETGVAFLGSIPRRRFGQRVLINAKHRKGAYLHFYQVLADQIYLLVKDKKLKTVLMTSTGKEEKIENVTLNLGMLLSQKGNRSVLLIDANFRNSILNRLIKADNAAGFSQVIEGKCSLKEATRDMGRGLHVVASGATDLNPVILLDSDRVKHVLAEAAQQYEVVLVDCPNSKIFKDASVLAPHTDAAIIVVSEGVTRRQVLKVAMQSLLDRKVNILGFILNNRTFPIPKFVYERV